MSERDDRRLNAYRAGDLSPHDQRALAQSALDDPDLFDELATSAAINAAAAELPAIGARRPNRMPVTWAFIGIAAAAAVVALVVVNRSPSTPAQPATTATSVGPVLSDRPVASPTATPPTRQPVLLAARLDEIAGGSAGQFRTAASESRQPKAGGVVVAIESGEIAIDLGSLDGLTKGSILQVSRGTGDARAIGRLTITTVFRERARGRIDLTDAGQVGDRVAVPAALQLNALLEQALARNAAGAAAAAQAMATRAVAIAATISDADSADAMNDLAAWLIRARDYQAAETMLRRVQSFAVGVPAVRVTNNLAAIAALRGDATAAESLYRMALELADRSPEYEAARRVIEKNLQDLGAAR